MSQTALSQDRSLPRVPALETDEAPTAVDDTPEPFGQMGVRQYAGRILAWIGVTGCLVCLAVGQRSMQFKDEAHWRSADQSLRVTSALGRLDIAGKKLVSRVPSQPGWGIQTRAAPYADDWQPSLWKTVGLEINPTQYAQPAAGFLVRMKWSSIAILAAIQPVWFMVLTCMSWVKRRSYQ